VDAQIKLLAGHQIFLGAALLTAGSIFSRTPGLMVHQ
jgi:hypothetical protein